MVAANTSWVSHGVYTLQQAAGILRIRPHMVNRWVYGSPLGEAALCAEYPDNYGEIVTFLDLVQTMAIRDIRSTKRLTLEKIRQTVEVANQLGIEFPFARKHTTYVFSDDVVLRLGDDRLIQVTGKYKENSLMEPIVYTYLEDLGYDKKGLAHTYTAYRQGRRSVQLNPLLNFGAPTVCPGKYTVATLVDAAEAEGNVDAAASLCGVNREDVQIAVDYEKELQSIA